MENIKLDIRYKISLIIIFILLVVATILLTLYFLNSSKNLTKTNTDEINNSSKNLTKTNTDEINNSSNNQELTNNIKLILKDDSLALLKATKLFYQDPSLNIYNSKDKGICIDLNFIYQKGFFEKGNSDGYYGSVLIENNNGNFIYSIWYYNDNYQAGIFTKNNEDSYTTSNNLTKKYSTCNNTDYKIYQ